MRYESKNHKWLKEAAAMVSGDLAKPAGGDVRSWHISDMAREVIGVRFEQRSGHLEFRSGATVRSWVHALNRVEFGSERRRSCLQTQGVTRTSNDQSRDQGPAVVKSEASRSSGFGSVAYAQRPGSIPAFP